MGKVRKVQLKKDLVTIGSLFVKDEVFIEYGDKPGLFYPESMETPGGMGFPIAQFEARDMFDDYFTEMDGVEFKETTWYKMGEEQSEGFWEQKLAEFDAMISSINDDKDSLKKLLS